MKQQTKKRKQFKRTRVFQKRTNRKQKRQHGGFLNRCDFVYAGRDMVNQATKVAPGVIKVATNDTNAIVTDRLNQIISHDGKEMERILPKILRGAIEDVYQTPFRLLGNFGKQQFEKIKRKIKKNFKNTYYCIYCIYNDQTINWKTLNKIYIIPL